MKNILLNKKKSVLWKNNKLRCRPKQQIEYLQQNDYDLQINPAHFFNPQKNIPNPQMM